MRDSVAVASGAAALHAWGASLLLTDASGAPPSAPPAAWQLFVTHSGCATALRSAIGTRLGLVPEPARALLQQASLGEVQRALSVRVSLEAIARVADAEHWPVVVVKGAADVARGTTVQLADIDLWAPAGVREELAVRLVDLGYASADGQPRHHLPALSMEHALPVEIHRWLQGFPEDRDFLEADSVPIAGFAPLLGLAPPDQAWSILMQGALAHPERRYRLRDLLLLRTAVRACSAAQRADLEHRVGSHPLAASVSAMMANAMNGVAPGHVRSYYLFLLRAGRMPQPRMARELWRRAAHISLEGVATTWRRVVLDQDLRATGAASRRLRHAALHAASAVYSSVQTRSFL